MRGALAQQDSSQGEAEVHRTPTIYFELNQAFFLSFNEKSPLG